MPYSAYISHMTWGVDLHPEVANWLESLSDKDYLNVMASLDALEIEGPKLGRPFVDHVKSSKHQNMKELRPPGKHFRLLFAFDPARRAIFLVAGDKTNDWEGWYKRNIPIADKRFSEHLTSLKRRQK
jgi:hypothetical protein